MSDNLLSCLIQVAASVALFAIWFYGIPILFPDRFTTKLQKSWIATTCSSIVMTSASIPFVISYFKHGSNLNEFPLLDSPIATTFCCFFIAYLLADMIFGYFVYPECMDLIIGWFHHTIYLILVPLIIQRNVQGAFLIASFMEFPTIFLAIGFLNKKWTSEYGFGVSFFLTRLVFHAYFAVKLIIVWPTQYLLIFISTITFPLHIYWFSRWVNRQIRIYKISKQDLECAPLMQDDVEE